MDSLEDRLCADFERLAGRVYSEEGIPMFLVCENLASNAVPVTLTQLNQDLATAFYRDAEAWRRLRPDASVKDVGKIVEVQADRDFGASVTEKNP